jgi:hypothetical protein
MKKEYTEGSLKRTSSLYLGIIKELEKNKSDEILVKEVLVLTEILKRDFSKRQLNILWMIFATSYYFGKNRAIIPNLSDFELCGVGKGKIREELDKLIEMNVIKVEKEFNYYTIKSPLNWTAPHHNTYNDERSKEIFFINLADTGVDKRILDDLVTKSIISKM